MAHIESWRGGSITITRLFISEIIREEFGTAFRKDLKSADGRYVRGWKGLTVDVAGMAGRTV